MQLDYNSFEKTAATQIVGVFLVGLVGTLAMIRHWRKSKPFKDDSIIPRLDVTESGHLRRLERFSHYVARQTGFEDPNLCPNLCKLAYNYLRKSEGFEESIYDFFANEANADSLYVKLIEEFDRCILSYFAFHWSQASLFISQVLNSSESEHKRKLKGLVLAATRKQRFERVTNNLKMTRLFSTLVEEMKAIGGCNNVMVPAAPSERSPVLLLMGGGMGAGKSTVLKDILKESFWSGARAKVVKVEADAFKESDVIYRALSSKGHPHDMVQTAELVHQSSTDAASSLLVTALNKGRDVIMDGTLSWEPFVEQTITMARNVHNHRYRMGPGYKVSEDGTVTENYWVQDEDGNKPLNKRPYRIELVGVVCDAYLAVIRGIRRAIIMGRAVRVNSQLRSHKRFASAFRKYCQLVDNARLYSTNVIGTPPTLIGWKDGASSLLVDPVGIKCLDTVTNINADAESIYELYEDPNQLLEPGSLWKEFVFAPSRKAIQEELKSAIQRAENPRTETDK